jgi:hypothetical protein
VGFARGFQPFVAIDLVIADNPADALVEDLGADGAESTNPIKPGCFTNSR